MGATRPALFAVGLPGATSDLSGRRPLLCSLAPLLGLHAPQPADAGAGWGATTVPLTELYAEQKLRDVPANSASAARNYVAVLTDVCRCLEALAQLTRRVESGGYEAAELKARVRFLLYSGDYGLEGSLASADTLVGLSDTSGYSAAGCGPDLRATKSLAVEAAESIDQLRDGVLSGDRQRRVVERLRLAQNSLVSFLRCVPRKALLVAEDVVEQEYAASGSGVFPWRSEVNTFASRFRPVDSQLLRELESR